MRSEPGRVIHPFAPVYDGLSEILVLGSFPSVRSREDGFYYGHPRNRFWTVVSSVYCEDIPDSIEEKRSLLLRRRIALWDVISSCEIVGSSDSSVRNPKVNDIRPILSAANIRRILCNGSQAYRLYEQYLRPLTGIEALRLPSTSPANASWSADRLIEEWKKALI